MKLYFVSCLCLQKKQVGLELRATDMAEVSDHLTHCWFWIYWQERKIPLWIWVGVVHLVVILCQCWSINVWVYEPTWMDLYLCDILVCGCDLALQVTWHEYPLLHFFSSSIIPASFHLSLPLRFCFILVGFTAVFCKIHSVFLPP